MGLFFLLFFFSRFFFFLYFFQIFVIADVSIEFNCFLRSRCSMEMWCPDDIGRDRLGLGWAACLGESMLQLPGVGWSLLVFDAGWERSHVYVDTTRKLIGKGALDGEELFTIEGSKNWRSTPGQPGGARKMAQNAPKNPSNRLAAINTAI